MCSSDLMSSERGTAFYGKEGQVQEPGPASADFDRNRGSTAAVDDYWDRLALRRIMDDLCAVQRVLAARVMDEKGNEGDNAVKAWIAAHQDDVVRTRAFLEELEKGGPPSVAKLSLANSHIQKMAEPAKM